MTDKISVSRKEIEALQKNFTKDGLSGNGDYINLSDLRALLDKAEVSELVASEFDKFHKEAYEVRIHQLETANETAKFVIRDKDKELTISVLHNKQLLDALKEACALAGDPRERDYDLICELLNRTIASVTIYAPPNLEVKIAELEAEVSRLNAIVVDNKKDAEQAWIPKIAIGTQVLFYKRFPEAPQGKEPKIGTLESYYDWNTAECGEHYKIKMAIVNVNGTKEEVSCDCLIEAREAIDLAMKAK